MTVPQEMEFQETEEGKSQEEEQEHCRLDMKCPLKDHVLKDGSPEPCSGVGHWGRDGLRRAQT